MTENSLAVKGVKNFCKNFTNLWVGSAIAECYLNVNYKINLGCQV